MNKYRKILSAVTLIIFLAACSTPQQTFHFMPKVNEAELLRQKPKTVLLAPVDQAGDRTLRNLLHSHLPSILDSVGLRVLPVSLSYHFLRGRNELRHGEFNYRFPVNGEFVKPIQATEIEHMAKQLGADAVLYIEINDKVTMTRSGYLNLRLVMTSSMDGKLLWNQHDLIRLTESGPGNIGGNGHPGIIVVAIIVLAIYLALATTQGIKNAVLGYDNQYYRLRDGVYQRIKKSHLTKINRPIKLRDEDYDDE